MVGKFYSMSRGISNFHVLPLSLGIEKRPWVDSSRCSHADDRDHRSVSRMDESTRFHALETVLYSELF